MSIETELRAYLVSKTAITDLTGTRVWVGNRPQATDTLPAITITRISGGHEHTLDGAAGSAMPRIQVDSWATTKVAVKALAEAVRGVMQGFSGTWGSTAIAVSLLSNQRDLDEQPKSGEDVWTYRVIQDYMVRYTESIPTFA